MRILCIVYFWNNSITELYFTTFFNGISHSINTDTHTCTSTHPYEYTHAHPTPMSTSKRLDRLDLEIHEVDQRAHHCRRDVTFH
jgi:hypothetical protein